MTSPTAQDVFNYDKNNLFGQFGMDPKGNNESGAWARRNQQLTGYGLTNATDYAVNTLEPARQANLNYMLSMLNPGNVQAQTKSTAAGMVNQGRSIGNQEATAAMARGFSPEFAQAIRNTIAANAQRNANQYVGQQDQRMMQNQQSALGIIGNSQVSPLLQQFLALAQLIEGRNAQNQKEKAAGSGLQSIGSLIGMLSGFDFGGGSNPAIGQAANMALGGLPK